MTLFKCSVPCSCSKSSARSLCATKMFLGISWFTLGQNVDNSGNYVFFLYAGNPDIGNIDYNAWSFKSLVCRSRSSSKCIRWYGNTVTHVNSPWYLRTSCFSTLIYLLKHLHLASIVDVVSLYSFKYEYYFTTRCCTHHQSNVKQMILFPRNRYIKSHPLALCLRKVRKMCFIVAEPI